MPFITFDTGIVQQEMSLRGLTILQVARDAHVSLQSVRRAINSDPMRSDTAVSIWNAIKMHEPAAEGFGEAVKMEAAG